MNFNQEIIDGSGIYVQFHSASHLSEDDAEAKVEIDDSNILKFRIKKYTEHYRPPVDIKETKPTNDHLTVTKIKKEANKYMVSPSLIY